MNSIVLSNDFRINILKKNIFYRKFFLSQYTGNEFYIGSTNIFQIYIFYWGEPSFNGWDQISPLVQNIGFDSKYPEVYFTRNHIAHINIFHKSSSAFIGFNK